MAKLIFWLFVLFLALSFFGISIESIIQSPAGQANLAYIGSLLMAFWSWLSTYANGLLATYHVS